MLCEGEREEAEEKREVALLRVYVYGERLPVVKHTHTRRCCCCVVHKYRQKGITCLLSSDPARGERGGKSLNN